MKTPILSRSFEKDCLCTCIFLSFTNNVLAFWCDKIKRRVSNSINGSLDWLVGNKCLLSPENSLLEYDRKGNGMVCWSWHAPAAREDLRLNFAVSIFFLLSKGHQNLVAISWVGKGKKPRWGTLKNRHCCVWIRVGWRNGSGISVKTSFDQLSQAHNQKLLRCPATNVGKNL